MLRWGKLFRAIDACVPREIGPAPAEFARRNEIFITSITSQKRDFEQWYAEATAPPPTTNTPAGPAAGPAMPTGVGVPSAGGLGAGAAKSATSATRADGPKGTGYVVRITGYHFHNLQAGEVQSGDDPLLHFGAGFLREHFLKKLEQPTALMLDIDGRPVVDQQGQQVEVPVKLLGIAFPTIMSPSEPDWGAKVANPFHDEDAAEAAKDNPEKRRKDEKANPATLVRYRFVVEFAFLDSPAASPAGDAVASTPAPTAAAPVVASPASATQSRGLTKTIGSATIESAPWPRNNRSTPKRWLKHHYWIVAGLGGVALPICWYLATANLAEVFDTGKKARDAVRKKVEGVPDRPAAQRRHQQRDGHPARRLSREVYEAWKIPVRAPARLHGLEPPCRAQHVGALARGRHRLRERALGGSVPGRSTGEVGERAYQGRRLTAGDS